MDGETLYKLTEGIAEVVRDGAKMCGHRLSERTGREINFDVRVSGCTISVMVVKGHGIVTPLVCEEFTICDGDERVRCAEEILREVEERFLSEYNRWKGFFDMDGGKLTCDAAKYGHVVKDADGFCRSMVDVGHIYMPSKTGPDKDTYYVSVGVIAVEGRSVGYAVVFDAEFMSAVDGDGARLDGGVADASYTLNYMGYDMHSFGNRFVLNGKTPMETFTEVYESILKSARDFVASVLDRTGVTETDARRHNGGEGGK